MKLDGFCEVWLVDTEYHAPPGDRPEPICLVAKDFLSGRTLRLWQDELQTLRQPPFSIAKDSLFVAYVTPAELSVFLALGWPMPRSLLDLYVEFRWRLSGLVLKDIDKDMGYTLLDALRYFGLPAMQADKKKYFHDLAIRGGPFTDEERDAMLLYCEDDVLALERLLPAMLPAINKDFALFRGRYTVAVAHMESNGIPMDMETWEPLCANWEQIKDMAVASVNETYNVFVPTGVKPITADTELGRLLLEYAREYEIDPHHLKDAVNEVYEREKAITKDIHAARRVARKATGLTPKRIRELEAGGEDLEQLPGLDVDARRLAAELPNLGLPPGYNRFTGVDSFDYRAGLVNLLRTHIEEIKPKHHPDILREAAELIRANQPPPFEHTWTFSTELFERYLASERIAWPRLASGELDLKDATFKDMARLHAQILPIREVRNTLSKMKLHELSVGKDGRNRTMLGIFGSKTGRNQPRNSRFIFGPATWLRFLIKPGPGRAISYLDWSQQEPAIAAFLSGDEKLKEAYRSDDFYLTCAKMAGIVPATATKKSHAKEREQFKQVALGVLYGLSDYGLALRLGIQRSQANELLRRHRETFPRFWKWIKAVIRYAMLHGGLESCFGWRMLLTDFTRPNTLRNFLMQSNGAEMLRIACCRATEHGIRVCAPVHDALLVEGALEDIDDVVAATQDVMHEASEIVLPGFPVRTDAKIVRYPDRYTDPRGEAMWNKVMQALATLKAGAQTAVEPVEAWK
jgi:DNA polymerase I-like protein with 3'-5' exonuclease and polymerase domains